MVRVIPFLLYEIPHHPQPPLITSTTFYPFVLRTCLLIYMPEIQPGYLPIFVLLCHRKVALTGHIKTLFPRNEEVKGNGSDSYLFVDSFHSLSSTPSSRRGSQIPRPREPGYLQDHRRALAGRDGGDQELLETFGRGGEGPAPAPVSTIQISTATRRQGRTGLETNFGHRRRWRPG